MSNPSPIDELSDLFQNSHVPTPRADLTDRIVAAARTEPPLQAANDRKPLIWSAVAGIAATIVGGLIFMTGQPTEGEPWAAESEQWASEAEAAGFGDLYAWVDGDPT